VEKISTGKRSSAAGPKEHRWALFECSAVERWNSKTYEVRAVVFHFFGVNPKWNSTRSMVEGGINTSLGPWHTRVFALLAGGRASSQWKRGRP